MTTVFKVLNAVADAGKIAGLDQEKVNQLLWENLRKAEAIYNTIDNEIEANSKFFEVAYIFSQKIEEMAKEEREHH